MVKEEVKEKKEEKENGDKEKNLKNFIENNKYKQIKFRKAGKEIGAKENNETKTSPMREKKIIRQIMTEDNKEFKNKKKNQTTKEKRKKQ